MCSTFGINVFNPKSESVSKNAHSNTFFLVLKTLKRKWLFRFAYCMYNDNESQAA